LKVKVKEKKKKRLCSLCQHDLITVRHVEVVPIFANKNEFDYHHRSVYDLFDADGVPIGVKCLAVTMNSAP
jgi:transposase